jgi:streptomycin 6-kinase
LVTELLDGRDELAVVAHGQFEQWQLRPDGPADRPPGFLVQCVRTSDGTPAVLKISSPGSGSEHEHLVLRRWAGNGAARLLRADPHRRAVLVERLHARNLHALTDTEACEVVAGLYRRLHVPALPQLPSLTSHVAQWTQDLERLSRGAPVPRRLVEHAIILSRDLASRSEDAVVLHGDLHYGTVLAADREPWLAIAPRPVNGDPHYELAPMLWHRWEELRGNIRDGVRRRFWTLVDTAGLDEDRARAWAVVRAVHAATCGPGNGVDPEAAVTRCVAIAKAVQD